MFSFVKGILDGGEIPSKVAQALLVLIPEETKLINMKGFKPSSLCNTTYKLVLKILVNT